MKNWKYAFAAGIVGALACSSEAQPPVSDAEASGKLAVNLTARDDSGQQYRLRNANFVIDGYSYVTGDYVPVNLTVSSETAPDSPTITTKLLQGYYYVNFVNEGWYFEKLTPEGPQLVEQAIFLGPNEQYTYVYPQFTTQVSFRFGIDGELIDFFGGDLEIGVTVEKPPTGAGGSTGAGGAFPEAGIGGAF